MSYQQPLFGPSDEQTPPPADPPAVAHPCPAHLFAFEADYITHQQQRAAYSRPRQHQQVVDARALPRADLERLNRDLERRVLNLDREAIAILVADVVGAPVHLALQVPVSLVPLQRRPLCLINLASGMVERDLQRLFVDRAAKPMANGRGMPATWILRVPLLESVHRAFQTLAPDSFMFGTLAELLGASFDLRRKSLEPSHTGRLRSTCARRTNGMTAAAVGAGLDHYRAALVLADPTAVNVARYYYTRITQRDTHDAAASAYSAGGLGPPVPPPSEWPAEAFGSHVVPSEEVLVEAFRWCVTKLDALRPPRKYTRRQIVDFHGAYIYCAGWLLLFCIGSRPTAQADVTADKVLPGTFSFRFADKATEESGERRPVLLCRLAQTLVKNVWAHWFDLERRLNKVERGTEPSMLLRHAREILKRAKVSLLAVEQGEGSVSALGTKAVQDWFDANLQIADNAGRHYWLSHFVRLRMSTRHADAFARHAHLGTEAMSSISAGSHYESFLAVAAAQDAELERLGFSALAGLGS